jgi:cytochrome c oxidase assembly protein subunit 15
MQYGKNFVRLNWITLVLIYLVVIAGSFVRITGSGMGCPDWPKCFGQWVPPTQEEQLPENYKDVFLEKRAAKLERFCGLLEKIGLGETADRIMNDESVMHEEDFNARKTWTEYINRLLGFLAGNGVLLIFLWTLVKYRQTPLLVLTTANLVILVFQAWFGSIVVATNLVPWTITVHMLLALVIIGIQLYILRRISQSQQRNILVTKWFYVALVVIFLVTFYQMFLGTQVREEVDLLRKSGIERGEWSDHFSLPFFIHRSFSWLVLILITAMFWVKRKSKEFRMIHWAFAVLIIELVSGILLAHFHMPGLVQTAHLLLAAVLFGILLMAVFRMKVVK